MKQGNVWVWIVLVIVVVTSASYLSYLFGQNSVETTTQQTETESQAKNQTEETTISFWPNELSEEIRYPGSTFSNGIMNSVSADSEFLKTKFGEKKASKYCNGYQIHLNTTDSTEEVYEYYKNLDGDWEISGNIKNVSEHGKILDMDVSGEYCGYEILMLEGNNGEISIQTY